MARTGQSDGLQTIFSLFLDLMPTAFVGKVRKEWAQSTSIVLMVFATLTMIVSLVRAERLPVISNGLLLGSVFTMLDALQCRMDHRLGHVNHDVRSHQRRTPDHVGDWLSLIRPPQREHTTHLSIRNPKRRGLRGR